MPTELRQGSRRLRRKFPGVLNSARAWAVTLTNIVDLGYDCVEALADGRLL